MQPKQRSLQGELTKAFKLKTILDLKVIAAGRTDAGVHGREQVATILIDDFRIPENKIVPAINTVLPNDIRLLDAEIVDKEYNARFDATAREYSYYITNDKSVFKNRFFFYERNVLDIDKMNQAANVIIGEHDFTTFSKVNLELNHYRCTVERSKWSRINETDLVFKIKANRFVYSMVRSLVGTMIEIGSGKMAPNYMIKALEERDRALCSKLAPAKGLFFDKAYFDSRYEILK
jgi:tRNA pseudouridine38-40 synthase